MWNWLVCIFPFPRGQIGRKKKGYRSQVNPTHSGEDSIRCQSLKMSSLVQCWCSLDLRWGDSGSGLSAHRGGSPALSAQGSPVIQAGESWLVIRVNILSFHPVSVRFCPGQHYFRLHKIFKNMTHLESSVPEDPSHCTKVSPTDLPGSPHLYFCLLLRWKIGPMILSSHTLGPVSRVHYLVRVSIFSVTKYWFLLNNSLLLNLSSLSHFVISNEENPRCAFHTQLRVF